MRFILNKIRQQLLKNGLKPFVIIGIIYVILLLSGKDAKLTDAFFYVVIYLIGKIAIYYFESKKINWKQSLKDISIFLFLVFLYKFLYLVLDSFGFRPFKILSNGIGFIMMILIGLTLIYITFIMPLEILKQKKK
ncbi:hypothetical protein [Bacillus sp. AFS041924]|uniref:hypothetical protein n=1 Tax=Bacillus sp. AFS041924 TaxID=2033503 RepID=UPI000BFCEDA2|nr:hypothetical protein [Bacillus sp. AFS041924]PGS48486.1 hypothetical protein COC46_18130 [Bacillus sp. AFS041924]